MKKVKKFILPLVFALTLIVTVVNFVACEKDCVGCECHGCDKDADCLDGMKCTLYYNSYVAVNLCAKPSSTCK